MEKLKFLSAIFLLIIVSSSCKEKESSLTQLYKNETNVDIALYTFHSLNSIYENDTIILSSNESLSYNSNTRGIVSIEEMFFGFQGDSVAVLYNDTLKVMHYHQSTLNINDIRDEVIEYNEPHNINNINSYSIEEEKGSYYVNYKAKYTFTNEDLQYAISINE